MDERGSRRFADRLNAMSDEELRFRGWTREGMRADYARRLEEDRMSPQVGDPAPDFRLERLGPAGERTGTYLQLSAWRGHPVGVIFGSYT